MFAPATFTSPKALDITNRADDADRPFSICLDQPAKRPSLRLLQRIPAASFVQTGICRLENSVARATVQHFGETIQMGLLGTEYFQRLGEIFTLADILPCVENAASIRSLR